MVPERAEKRGYCPWAGSLTRRFQASFRHPALFKKGKAAGWSAFRPPRYGQWRDVSGTRRLIQFLVRVRKFALLVCYCPTMRYQIIALCCVLATSALALDEPRKWAPPPNPRYI